MAEKLDSDPGFKQGEKASDVLTTIEKQMLPHDLVVDILSRLPATDLSPLRFMCKSWYELITRDSKFAKAVFDRSLQIISNSMSVIAWGEESCYNNATKKSHLDVYLATHHTECDKAIKLDLPFLSHEQSPSTCAVYSICNGMLCLWDPKKPEVYIWNPLTNDHITIPYPDTEHSKYPNKNRLGTVFGFGFLESANEYKIVRLRVKRCQLGRRGYSTELSVYTLGVDFAWRTVQTDIPYVISFESVPCRQANDHLFWIAKPDGEMSNRAILAFDLRDESLYEMFRLPIDDGETHMTCVQELAGTLRVIKAHHQRYVDIYGELEVSDDGDCGFPWQCTIGRAEIDGDFSIMIPLGMVAESGDIIVLKNSKGLITYNPTTKAINYLKRFGFSIANAYAFIGSLNSPRAISGVGDNQKKKNRRRRGKNSGVGKIGT